MKQISAQERKAVAQRLEMSEQYLYQVLTGRRRLPPHKCQAVERAFGGRVTVDQLRDDLRWVRVPDPTWPHHEGRPLMDSADVAGAAQAAQEAA